MIFFFIGTGKTATCTKTALSVFVKGLQKYAVKTYIATRSAKIKDPHPNRVRVNALQLNQIILKISY